MKKIQLPTEIEGRKISWEEDIPETGWKILAGLCCWRRQSFSSRTKTCMIWWRKKKREERRSYPEILQKADTVSGSGIDGPVCVLPGCRRLREGKENEGDVAKEALRNADSNPERYIWECRKGQHENFGKRTGVRNMSV